MSQFLAPASPVGSPRRTIARLWDAPDSRSVIIGIVGMLLVHALLYLIGPWLLRMEPSFVSPTAANAPQEYSIELEPEVEAREQPKPPDPFNFVEANPNAPENIPDQTPNFAAHNQQVAQETPTPDGVSDRPALEGRTDVQSTQIVTGQLAEPVESAPAPPAVEEQVANTAVAAPRLEQNPLSGFDKNEGEAADGFATNIAKATDNPTAVPEAVEGMKNVPLVPGATSVQPQIDPKRPRPRPQVVKQQQVRPAIFQENKLGTKNIGAIAYDAKWSNYGQYLQKMIETVQIQWERILIESRVYPPSGTTVKVIFKMNTEGRISQIVEVSGTAGNQAEKACTSAITARAPYGPWTDDMIAVLGQSQELTFNFFYQ